MGKKSTFYPFYVLTWVLSEMLALPHLELLLSHNLFNKKKFFDKFLMDVREKYNEQVKL